MLVRTLAVLATCVGVNARPLPARPVGTLSEPFWGGDTPATPVKTAAHKNTAARKPASTTAHKAAPKHAPDDSHGQTATKHTLADGHNHSSPEVVQPAEPVRKLTREEKAAQAAQTASEARNAVVAAAEAERAKAEAKRLRDEEERIATDEQRIADSEAERKRVEKMQRAAEPSTATSTAGAKQLKATSSSRQEKKKGIVLLSSEEWPYPDLPQDDPGADDHGEAPAANDCVSVAAGASDFWCQQSCKGSYCPAELCRCGDDQAADADQASEQAGAEKECKSVDATTTDIWCQTTCVNAHNCPAALCNCDSFTGERLKARRAERARVCDFDARVCTGTGGGAVDCRSCDGHISTCMSTTHEDKARRVQKTTLDDCLDEVAGLGEECRMCNTKESNKAYQMRLGTWQDEAQVDASTGWPTDQEEAAAAAPPFDPDEQDEGVRHWQTDANWSGPKDIECKSRDAQATDHWCQTTCSGSADNNCPKALCECKTFSGSEMRQRAEEKKRTCDFDAQGCIGADCRSCDAHISTCKGTTHLDKEGNVRAVDVEDCMDEVAGSADGCSLCSTAESKKAYRVRLGLPEGAR